MKWAFKIAAKLVLARLPVPYAYWKSLGLFRHGRMDTLDYSLQVFNLHQQRAYPGGLPPDCVLLELGPGDSVASAVIAKSFGVKRLYLVDAGNYANRDISFYQALAARLRQHGLPAPQIAAGSRFEDVLEQCNAIYLTQGLASLASMPSASIDFCWSHSVLEHVRKQELANVLKELSRVIAPQGLASHNIDYQDHLDHSLNNLRFSDRVWESALFANSGFYTNRIPAIEMHRMFRRTGFHVMQEEFGRWPQLPIARRCLHQAFQGYASEELINRTSHVLLGKADLSGQIESSS